MVINQKELKALAFYDKDIGDFVRLKDTKRSKAGTVMGCKHPEGSIIIYAKKRKYKAHRLAILYVTGELPTLDVDHINHKQDDNRYCNLREGPCFENSRNHPLYASNKSGITGVRWVSTRNKWLSRITDKGTKDIFLGYFDDFFSACCARKRAEIVYNYHTNNGRGRSDSIRANRVRSN